jgi:adenylosuccinate lyase
MIENRYSSTNMKAIWSDNMKYYQWLGIEVMVVNRLHDTSRCPDSVFNEISLFKIDHNDIEEIKNIESIVKHDVLAFTQFVGSKLSKEAASFWHRGLTSSDLVDTANALRITKSLGLVIGSLIRVIDSIDAMATTYKDVAMVGRTHGQHTEPITIGHKFNMWKYELLRSLDRLNFARDQIAIGKLSGPVGLRSGGLTEEDEKSILSSFGLGYEKCAGQIVHRDRYAILICCIAIMASSLEKFTTDIRLMSLPEVCEMVEAKTEGQRGSSSMPHKCNPISSEKVAGLARILRSFVVAGMENQILWHERDISHSSAERYILPIIFEVSEHILITFNNVLNNLHINMDNITKNMNITNGNNMSGVILCKLQQSGMSYCDAYDEINKLINDGKLCRWEEEIKRY